MKTNWWQCAVLGLLCVAGSTRAEFGSGSTGGFGTGKLGSETKPVEKPAMFDPQIRELYNKAKLLYQQGRFDQAEAACQQILAVRADERNTLQLLREITDMRQRVPAADPGAALKRKLAGIKIPRFNASAASIQAIVGFLQEQSGQHTADKTPVNIVWNVPATAKLTEVSFELYDSSVAEILKWLTEPNNLRCRYDENAVVVCLREAAAPAPAEPMTLLGRKLQQTVVPEYVVLDAAARDALSHLQELAGKAAGDKNPISVVWNVPATQTLPTVTLKLYKITAADAFKYFAEITGLQYRVDDRAVVISGVASAEK